MGEVVRVIGSASEFNYADNGQFDFFQRKGSVPQWLNEGNLYTADRWFRFKQTGGGSGVFTNIQDAGLTNGSRSIKIGRISGSTDLNQTEIIQALESDRVKKLKGKRVTFSFKVRKGANFSGSTVNFYIASGTGTDQGVVTAWTGAVTFNATAIPASSLSTTIYYQAKLTVDLPLSINQLRYDINYIPTGTAGANDWIEITEVMFNLGEFQPYIRSGFTYEKDYERCRYFFQKTYRIEDTPGANLGDGRGGLTDRWPTAPGSNNELICVWEFDPVMRTVPVITLWSTTGVLNAFKHDVPGTTPAFVHAEGTSAVRTAITNNGATNTAFHRVHCTAEAEL